MLVINVTSIYVLTGCDRPSKRELNNHVILKVAGKWRNIGEELLDADSVEVLEIIEHNNPKV